MTVVLRFLGLFLLGLTFLMPSGITQASSHNFTNTVRLSDDKGEYRLGGHLMILEDPSKQLAIDQVRQAAFAERFLPSTQDVPGFGFSRSAYWVRISVDGMAQRESQWVLEFGHSPMQWIDVYTEQGGYITSHQRGGSEVRYLDRRLRHHRHIFEVSIPPGVTTNIFVRVDGDNSKTIPLSLYRWDVFAEASSNELALLSIYGGIVVALLLYNLFVFLILRENVYLLYVGFLFFLALLMLSTKGVTQKFISPQIPVFGDVRIIPFSVGAATLFGALFMSRFLSMKTSLPLMHKTVKFFAFGGFSVCTLAIFADYRLAILVATITGGSLAPWALLTGFLAVVRGNAAARYFLLAWAMLAFGIILYSLKLFGLIPSNSLTEYTWLWGSAAEAVLLAVALAARMRVMREEKEKAQTEQIKTQEILFQAQQESLASKQVALDTVQKYSHKLEHEVKVRTAELVDTQQKLIASEKMAALGVFTAGMAHEINNPANFVAAGAQNAEAQLGKFKGFVDELLDDEAPDEIKGEFGEHFTKLGDSLSVVRTGITRIENVVKHLRATHPEGDVGMQPADVVDSLESAWRVLSPTVRTPILLSTQWDSRLQVLCMIAEIHQVFLALLSNAAHAIEDAVAVNGPDYKGEIKLTSHEADGKLVITVSDNGIGIPAARIDKVFDPFFTTKTVGRGAGLGLSMARDVVKKHGGALGVESSEGQGSTFNVALPLT